VKSQVLSFFLGKVFAEVRNTLPRGFCAKCGKEVGTFLKPKAWLCPTCKKIYCAPCSPKLGFVFKKPACPECGVELLG
jgi:hypothetical protein